MALLGKKTRKTSAPATSNESRSTPISVKNLTLTDGNSVVYFKRLGYKNCPRIRCKKRAGKEHLQNEFRDGDAVVDMDRWNFVAEMYEVISNLDNTSRTKLNRFHAVVVLVKFCDQKEISDLFSERAIELFVIHLKGLYIKGLKGETLQAIQSSLKAIIKELNLPTTGRLLELFYPFPRDTTAIQPYSDQEVKLLVQSLHKIVFAYKHCLLKGEQPKIFPLYDEAKIKQMGFSSQHYTKNWNRKLSSGNNIDSWKMDLVRAGYYLMCFFTGINARQLIYLKASDVTDGSFIQASRGKYIFSSIKNRQKGRHNLDEVGFTSRAKDFIESWVTVAKMLDTTGDEYLFPRFVNGVSSRQNGSSIYSSLNHSFESLGLPRLNNRRFRKTKASLIMRATNSIFSVAEGLNNTPETAAKHYADGDPVTSEMTLAAMINVRERTARGESLPAAKENSIFSYVDPIRESYLKKNETLITAVSPVGVRCNAPFGQKAKKLKESLVDANLAKNNEQVACHKFIECFGCRHHAIIAEVEDVWLMLSFRDVLLSVMTRPSINSRPGDVLLKLLNTVESILLRLKTEYLDIYTLAMERYMDGPHPLWSSEDDFDLLMDAW